MKTTNFLSLLLSGVASAFVCCSPTQKTETPNVLALDSLKAHYAPDHRVAVFDVSCAQQGSVGIARGDVDNPKAKDDALAAVRKALGGEVIDSIRVLPDPQLGDKLFGIVAVSVGNVRSNPRHSAELATQAMMGTVAKLLKKQGGWYFVQLPDKYLGWLEDAAMKVTNAAGVESWKAAPKVIVTNYFAIIREQPTATALPVRDAVAGALMKQLRVSGQWAAVELPDGRAGYIEKSNVDEYGRWKNTRKLTAENIEKTAKMFLGVPYLWGGTSPKGMDCSGFTKTVYRLNGLELSRDADQQAEGGDDVKAGQSFENLKKGDLLFFGRKGTQEKPEHITHVGIYLEKLEFINTPGGSWVKFNSFDPSASNYSDYMRRNFVRARRYIGTAQVPEVRNN
jgi:gamma-D-glutamyl-L-lysine dipeptidyl-peptidase